MEERTGSWAEVEQGSYVRDKKGKAWRVEGRRPAADGRIDFALMDPKQVKVITTQAAYDPATILEPTIEEAMTIVGERLGGQMLATYEAGKPAICPPLTRHLQRVHAHFHMMHGVWTASGPGSKSILRLLEMHRDEHLNPAIRSHGWWNHEHH